MSFHNLFDDTLIQSLNQELIPIFIDRMFPVGSFAFGYEDGEPFCFAPGAEKRHWQIVEGILGSFGEMPQGEPFGVKATFPNEVDENAVDPVEMDVINVKVYRRVDADEEANEEEEENLDEPIM